MSVNIAIDGPAGAGKSTIAKLLAKKMGFVYVDTGAMYRAMAYYFLTNELDPTNQEKIEEAAQSIDVSLEYVDGQQNVLLNGENVNGKIRNEAVGNMASNTSVYPKVRAKLVALQQKLAASTDVIMDGRDIGSVVLPDADVKFFLTASSAVRAKRRFDELTEKGVECDLNQIEKDIIDRDERDMNRETSPLTICEDAVFVDSSYMTIEEVVDSMISMINEKTNGNYSC